MSTVLDQPLEVTQHGRIQYQQRCLWNDHILIVSYISHDSCTCARACIYTCTCAHTHTHIIVYIDHTIIMWFTCIEKYIKRMIYRKLAEVYIKYQCIAWSITGVCNSWRCSNIDRNHFISLFAKYPDICVSSRSSELCILKIVHNIIQCMQVTYVTRYEKRDHWG